MDIEDEVGCASVWIRDLRQGGSGAIADERAG